MYNIQSLNTGIVKYRLGDAILLRNSAIGTARGVLHPTFKGTIGYEYVSMNDTAGDIECMNRLIDKHIELHNYKLPEDDEVVVHLRIGDNGPPNRRRNKLVKDGEFDRLVKLIKETARGFSDRIVVVTAVHSVEGAGDSEYGIVKRLCSEIPVTIKSSPNIDEDFCYLARAKRLVVTKGNFSDLAGRCNPNYVVRLDGRDPLNHSAD